MTNKNSKSFITMINKKIKAIINKGHIVSVSVVDGDVELMSNSRTENTMEII